MTKQSPGCSTVRGARNGTMHFFQVRSGCVVEQECAGSRIDPLLLPVADFASLVEAVGLYDHQIR